MLYSDRSSYVDAIIAREWLCRTQFWQIGWDVIWEEENKDFLLANFPPSVRVS
jgi:hypothetical protein